MQKLLIEAFFVGIAVVVIGSAVGYIISKLFSVDLPQICKKWNKNHVMELSLFLTGAILHLLCEGVGLNKWYCKNGNACSK